METKTLTRGQLRLIADSEQASPQERINAVNSLLQLYGGSDRTLRLARRICKRFRKFIGDTEIGQRRIRWAAEQLAARIARISDGETVQPNDCDDSEADLASSAPEPSQTSPRPIVGGLDLLPVDGDNDYWDELIGARSRRELFLMSYNIDRLATRAEIIAAISDPSRISAHLVELKSQCCSRDLLDAQFASDKALMNAALEERGLTDPDELARQVLASGVPLCEFSRDQDFNGDGLPVLVRSKAGELIRALDFTNKWPTTRATHQPL